jgi:beta propeller repeat protein
MQGDAMRIRYLTTSTEVLFLAGLLASVGQGGDWQEFALWPTTDEQELPDIWGDIIVWQQFVAEYGDYDIYIADINNPSEPLVFVIGDSNDQTSPAVYENMVVWQDYVVWEGSADWDIRVADINNLAEPQIFAVSDIVDNNECNPAIHGNTVVWQDGDAGDFNIYGADITDLSNPVEFQIAEFEHDQQNPAVYRTTVVWQDNFFGDWDIYAADIWRRNKPEEAPVSYIENDQQRPAIWGNIVVWQDNFFGDWDIYAADISDFDRLSRAEPNNPVEFAITTNESSQMNPDIEENIVVWQDNRNNNWDIFGYNLTTQKEFQITDESHDQTNPVISGNVVVWQDNRNGNSEIYAVVLDGPEVAWCTSRIAGDVNGDCKIDFADFAIMASRWLECYLEPAEACW